MRTLFFILVIPQIAFGTFLKGWHDGMFYDTEASDKVKCKVQTTDATATLCKSRTLGNDPSVWKIVFECTGREGSTVFAAIDKCALFKRDGASASLVGTVITTFDQPGGTGWDITLTASGAAVEAKVVGLASKTIDWTCVIRTVKRE